MKSSVCMILYSLAKASVMSVCHAARKHLYCTLPLPLQWAERLHWHEPMLTVAGGDCSAWQQEPLYYLNSH